MKKAQIINIDLMMGYLAFIIFVWFFSNYSLELLNPFIDFHKFQINEKNTMILANLMFPSVDLKNFDKVCNITITGNTGNEVTYKIIGFDLFNTDLDYITPNLTEGSIVFVRNFNELAILTGTNSTKLNSSVTITLPETIVRTESTLTETDDSISYNFDVYGNVIIKISSYVNSTDGYDEFKILTGFETSNFAIINSIEDNTTEDITNVAYLGALKLSDYCSEGYEKDSTSNMEYFKKLEYNNENLLAQVTIKSWWEE